ncbi:methionine ABC transporter permease [Acinetobacter baumannii]|uniref:methionine ABC transporter permease n=1 Tax=Acinetobacter baumannii TaxID=470 RepID=UPI00280F25F7|nr:methionine ABC transporter permease [Acinetobacter baumannii]MDQ8919321.1 methionine ABC transporter permease [Acinetobacter baumannii]MDQ8950274.1 methionine ABC transporter permease [Acinetobacter baumannii]MDQ8964647.1 methionine ABC transporter permease [Acinetobacter baumannii]MDQ8967981.1 methionine ABC transporter permease [Acinetobacter baumannii]MDQ8982135.1 methionine ABC transporter permease [Acinetobacter baumannii]
MLNSIIPVLPEIQKALFETLYMVSTTVLFGVIFGSIVGTLLYITTDGSFAQNKLANSILNSIVSFIRSFPFLILAICVVPLSRFIVGTSIGTSAAIVPLTISCIPYFARFIESALLEVNRGVIEAAQAMGATKFQIVTKVLFSEARSNIASAITIVTISYFSYSTIVGIVGGGGIGDFAIRYGFYRFETDILIFTVAIIIIIVQIIQFTGNFFVKFLDKRI